MYKNCFKRILDFFISLIGLIVLSPLFISLIVWLHFSNKGSGVFFTQERPGKNARPFKVIKFKTMSDERDEAGNILPDKERLTNAGIFIRSTSIDELPQLLNVLKGDMSLVGPRPLMPAYLKLYSPKQARRHEVRPGITGWAQCNGRNGISWEKRFEFDVWYIDHLTILTDIRIIFITIKKVVCRDGINFKNAAELEAFNGHN